MNTLSRSCAIFAVLLAAAAPLAAAFNPRLLFVVKPDPIILDDHNGTLLTGNITVNLFWYGSFTLPQRAVVAEFIQSISYPHYPHPSAGPTVASWWNTTKSYRGGGTNVALGLQLHDEKMSLGKLLSYDNVTALAARAGHHQNAVTVVLTSADVAVERFCMSSCAVHDHAAGGKNKKSNYTFIWAGDSAAQCPGQCAWPFAVPEYGPQADPLIPPNGDVGADGMVITVATVLAGTVTNPFGTGYYMGDAGAVEAGSVCVGIFGTGAYPGYPGKLLTDAATGASYNAVGVNARKFLLPALWDPTTQLCKTLV